MADDIAQADEGVHRLALDVLENRFESVQVRVNIRNDRVPHGDPFSGSPPVPPRWQPATGRARGSRSEVC